MPRKRIQPTQPEMNASSVTGGAASYEWERWSCRRILSYYKRNGYPINRDMVEKLDALVDRGLVRLIPLYGGGPNVSAVLTAAGEALASSEVAIALNMPLREGDRVRDMRDGDRGRVEELLGDSIVMRVETRGSPSWLKPVSLEHLERRVVSWVRVRVRAAG